LANVNNVSSNRPQQLITAKFTPDYPISRPYALLFRQTAWIGNGGVYVGRAVLVGNKIRDLLYWLH